MSNRSEIIRRALEARTYEDAIAVQRLVEADIGARYERPIADVWSNFGLMSATGSADHKLLEAVTNMQDAVVERAAVARFGDLAKVPFTTPHEAAGKLLGHLPYEEVAQRIRVDFFESDPPARKTKKITAVFRDEGAGIEPGYVADSIFSAGSKHKSQVYWQQGAFGAGAKSTLRHAQAAILISRRAPEFNPAEDRILVAVVLWAQFGKGMSARYLTATDWAEGANPDAEPWSTPARAYPEFEPGTHLALISYGVEGFHRKEGDQRGFDRVLDTRLFQPVTPMRFTNRIVTSAHPKNLRGLRRQLAENPRPDRREGTELLPFCVKGKTYHLPVSFYVFMAPAGKTGARRNFVAYDHAVVFTSNGQVHHRWKPDELHYKTKLNRLRERIFVVVETDELPIQVRTELFPATRAGMVSTEDARRLEDQVAAFLDEWEALQEINSELIRQSLMAQANGRPTLQVAKQISRALQMKGFAFTSGGTGTTNGTRKRRPVDLYPDPTTLDGPGHIVAEVGSTKSLRYVINARDEFMASGRGQLSVSCDHPEINGKETTVGQLHNGGIRVMLAIPDEAELGTFNLRAAVRDWQRSAGGFGPDLEWRTKLEIVAELPETKPSTEPKTKGKADEGPTVALVWDNLANHEDWTGGIPGEVDEVPASEIARREEYKELAARGDVPVPTIFLNEDFTPLKKYIGQRQRNLSSEDGPDRARNRYAVGVGVGLAILDQEAKKQTEAGKTPDEKLLLASKQATAQAVLNVLPAFDQLTKETGVDV